MKRWLLASGLAVSVALPWLGSAQAKDKPGPTLRWAKSWGEAVAQAKDRNAVIFATFHKDN
jgi:hypothetical protein